jgi:hypothetical protein
MRTLAGAGHSTRRRGGALLQAVLAAGLVAGTGCATLRATVAGYASGPDGIAHPQQQLREALVDGDIAKALAWREDDALLRSLTTGIAAYSADQFARAAALLDTAALQADDRITASLSRDGLSMVTNDMARPYQPRRTERLFIPYYAMLSYVRLGAWEDAAVEARRLVGLLAQYGDDRVDGERGVHGAMQHLAGAVFERAGERNEAQVSYRVAHALNASLPKAIARGTIADEGELLLVVERGFVAHRATETLELFVGGDDRDSLRLDGEGRGRAAARIADRAMVATQPPAPPRSSSASIGTVPQYRKHEESRDHHDDDDGYHLTIAFPSLRRSARPWGSSVRLAVDGSIVGGLEVGANVDDASAVDAQRERLAIATRAVARAVAKYALTKAVTDKKGEMAGRLANIGTSLLERADVRSWHLLPQEIALVRVRVPAGTRAVRVEVGEGRDARTRDVGSVLVRRGELTIVPVRLWRDPAPGSVVEASPGIAGAGRECATFFCP